MIVRTGLLIILGFYSCIVSAIDHKNISTCQHSFTKECRFSTGGQLNFNADTKIKNIPLTINHVLIGKMGLYHSKAHQVDSVRGSFLLDNKSNTNITIHYHVTLKDKKGALAQTKGSFELKPGKNLQKVKIGNMVLSKQDIKNINSYEIKITGTR